MRQTRVTIRTTIPLTALAASLVSIAVIAGCHKGAPKDILTSGTKLYSQFNEELIIRHFFDDRRGGTFVDVGAWHWRDGSTTLYLEKHLGWTGIAVDAQDSVRQGYSVNRPGTRFFNYAVADRSGQRVKFYLGGQLSSTGREYTKTFGEDKAAEPPEIEVETITLDDLLEREGLRTIDFLSMDIEQGEPAALAGFDIGRYRPRLVCIEAHEPVRPALTKYFAEHGYERIEEYLDHDDLNWYYRPKRD